jgi:hypothetical protein
MKNPFNFGQPRCSHRHTRAEHPQCFPTESKSGTPLPKVLFLDIETAPMSVFVWGLYKQRISPDKVIHDTFILSWAGKWLFDPAVYGDGLSTKEALNKDDSRILSSLWNKMNEADIIIGHNLRAFDIKKINARFIANNMAPPAPYETVDTLSVARSTFGFSSNKLDYINEILGLNRKAEVSFQDWKECLFGNKEALEKMALYNKNDVCILEELYLKLRPWIKSHPNLGLYIEDTTPVCRNCGNTSLLLTGKYAYTECGMYQVYRCGNCSAVIRCKTNELPREKKKNLLV